MSDKTIEVALAILTRDNKFLMQLRDNKPDILYPDHWGLFGGHLEPEETPEEAVIREIYEEIGYIIINIKKMPSHTDVRILKNHQSEQPPEKFNVIRHVYYSPLLVPPEQLILKEGCDLALVSPEEILSMECYSPKLGAKKPLVPAAYEILLDFMCQEKKYSKIH